MINFGPPCLSDLRISPGAPCSLEQILPWRLGLVASMAGPRFLGAMAKHTSVCTVATMAQYWVRVPGFPWWPAKTVDPESTPKAVRKARPEGDDLACFKFYGENNYSWACLTDPEEALPLEYSSSKAKKANKTLQKALAMAQRDGGALSAVLCLHRLPPAPFHRA